MRTVNIHEAKTHLSRLLQDIAQGESFIIAKAGKPIAKVIPFETAKTTKPKRIGFMAGEFVVPDDFDRMGEDEIARQFGMEP